VRALVLGGGGIAGIAWETGILYGLGDAALDVDLIIGTSAGSAVAAAVTSGVPLAELFERQTAAVPQTAGSGAPPLERLIEIFTATQGLPPQEGRRKLGELALSADTMPEDAWKARIGANLPSHEWPSRNIATVAVDTRTGEHRIFDRDSGVDLLSAVAASCAVPGVYPPVTIEGRRYMDGGVRTTTNADLVADYDDILVIAPIPDALNLPNARVITPDTESLSAMSPNPLDPATRIPSARAGRTQGQALDIRHR
jgi:NTE family protein